MKYISIFIGIFVLISCTNQKKDTSFENFEQDILALKEYFHIPGIAVLVKKDGHIIYENYMGYADLENQIPVDSTSIFPIASITKTFATVLLLQLVQEGKVDLEDPINKYLEDTSLTDSIKIKHVLSHSSEGIPGSFFNYSSRFFLLTNVIEKSSGVSLADLIGDRIIEPLKLNHTIPLIDQNTLDSINDRLAKPYYFYGEVEKGHFDVGLSTASGLASVARDIAKFDNALETNSLINIGLKEEMLSPFITDNKHPYPYGYGIFTQEFLDKKIKWGYGQEDCFSSLLLKVPEENLTLILLANNNLMSDPARLINGDITYSLFAMSFLKNFVFDLPIKWNIEDFDSPENSGFKSIKNDTSEFSAFYRQEILANALAASFIGHVDSLELEKSKNLTQFVLNEYPDYKQYGNQSLMRLLMVLSTNGDFRNFDKQIVDIGEELLSKNRHDPYTNVYLGYHYMKLNNQEKAFEYFKNIAEAQNLQPFWYSIEAYDFLGDFYKQNNPELAKSYFQKIVDIGWNIGGKLDKAKIELQNL